MVINYSKWENIDTSSADESIEEKKNSDVNSELSNETSKNIEQPTKAAS